MKQAQITKPNEMEIIEISMPIIAEDEVLIRVKKCGICGTDTHIFHGGFDPQFPVVPGHEFSGVVVCAGDNCQRIKEGMRVAVEPNIPCNNCRFCLNNQHNYCENMITPGVTHDGGFGEYVAVKEIAVFDIGTLDFSLGALVEPLSCVLHGIDKVEFKLDSRVLILGAGPIGLMLGYAAQAKGCACIDFLDIDDFRLEMSQELGFNDIYRDLKEIQNKYNIIIDATGFSPIVGDSVKFLAPEGQLLAFGVPQADSKLILDHYYVFKHEIKIISALTSKKDTLRAISFLNQNALNMSHLISHEISLEEFVEYMKGNFKIENTLKILVRP